MLLSRTAIRRPVFTTMVIASLVVFGLVAYRTLGVDLFPRVEFPVVTILTQLPGADPETIETTVTDPIEEAVNTLSGIKHLRSTSADSFSQVAVEFELTKDVDVAFQEVSAKVAAIRSRLPSDIEEPVIEKLDVDSAPVTTVVVAGDLPFRELSRIADTEVKERLQTLEDVGSARLVGFRDRKIWLWLSPRALESHGLAVGDVVDALRRQHVEVPAGSVKTGPKDIAVTLAAEFEDRDELEQMVVSPLGAAPVRLADVGIVEDGLEEETSRARLDGAPCVAILVRRQSGKNTVQVATRIAREVERLRKDLALRGVRLELAQEQAPFIQKSLAEVEHHLVIGGVFAVLVVLLFLRNIRSTLICGLVLPTSVVATFMALSAMGFTLNQMTLLGLTLAIGLLIDDAIVVQENILRHVEAGVPPRQAADEATSEIGLAVLATTMSVVAVFIPVAFMGGMVGRFFFAFSLTVSVAVLLSMFVSFTLDPMLSSRVLRKPGRHNVLFRAFETAFAAIDRAYEVALARALRVRWLVVLLAIGAFASIPVLAKGLRFEFLPVEDQSEFTVKVRAPLGASVEKTASILGELRARLADLPEKEYILETVGDDELARANEGSLYVKLVDLSKRTRSQEQVMADARTRVADVRDATVSVQIVPRVSGGGRRWAMVQYELRGRDLGALDRLSKGIRERMRRAGGYVDVDSTFETGKPEADLHVLRDRAADLGVDPQAIGQTLRASVGGLDVATWKAEGDRFDIAVRLLESARNRTDLLGALSVRGNDARLVELRNVTRLVEVGAPVEISRYGRLRQITVLANLEGKVLGEATDEIERFAREAGLPPDVRTGWAGFADVMKETSANMGVTFVLALIMIYMVLASQFESFVHPLTIMLTLPLAFIGAFAALVLTGKTVSIFVMVAFVFLMGLVAKNAILLVDFANRLRREKGLDAVTALVKAGSVRLRPILMTTVAMIAGMGPVAVAGGAGSESRQPMAIAIVGGLVSSTILTLFVVPTAYSLLASAGDWLSRLAWRRVDDSRVRSQGRSPDA